VKCVPPTCCDLPVAPRQAQYRHAQALKRMEALIAEEEEQGRLNDERTQVRGCTWRGVVLGCADAWLVWAMVCAHGPSYGAMGHAENP
jgi:hypothetical protein